MGEVGSTIENCTEPKVARSLTEHYLSHGLNAIGMYLVQKSRAGLSKAQLEEKDEKIREQRNRLSHNISLLSDRMLYCSRDIAAKHLKEIATILDNMSIPDDKLTSAVYERWEILKTAF